MRNASCLKHLPLETLGRIEVTPRCWGQILPLEAFPNGLAVLMLPDGLIEFDETRGFWPHLAAYQDPEGQPLLLIHLNSFDLTTGPGHSWAIPLGPPPNSHYQLLRELGFGEGWELSYPEALLLLRADWSEWLQTLRQTAVVGVAVEGGTSLYPVRFQPEHLQQIDAFLGALA